MSDSVLKECLKELQKMSKDEVIKKCKELNLYSDKYSNEKYKDDSFEVILPVNIEKNNHRHVNPTIIRTINHTIRRTQEGLVGGMAGRRFPEEFVPEEFVRAMAVKAQGPVAMTARECAAARTKKQGNKSKTSKATK